MILFVDEEVKRVNEGCSEAGADKPMDGETSDAATRKPEHAYLEISFDDMNVNKPPIEESRNGAHTPPTRDTGPGGEVKVRFTQVVRNRCCVVGGGVK